VGPGGPLTLLAPRGASNVTDSFCERALFEDHEVVGAEVEIWNVQPDRLAAARALRGDI
jgi:hypothetical protein